MEDTLRYFFSAIFQGIAAILTLGAMFYTYFLDKARSRISELEKDAWKQYPPNDPEVLEMFYHKNIIEVLIEDERTKYIHPYDVFRVKIIDEFKAINQTLNKIKNMIPYLLIKGILLLVISSTALFAVGYGEILNWILFYAGILTLIITYSFIITLYNLILSALDLKDVKELSLRHFIYDYDKD